jgi:hypothetical protein
LKKKVFSNIILNHLIKLQLFSKHMGLYSFENKDKFEIIHIINIQNDDTLKLKKKL